MTSSVMGEGFVHCGQGGGSSDERLVANTQLPLLPDPLWTVPTSLPRSQPSLVLLPMHDKTEWEFFLQRLRTSIGSSSSPPGLFPIWASPARHLWHYFFYLWPLVQPLGRGLIIGSSWSSSTPTSLGRGRVAPPPTFSCKVRFFENYVLFARTRGLR